MAAVAKRGWKRHLPWLGAAVVLFAAASFLMRDPGAKDDVPDLEKHDVHFPRYMMPAEYQRGEKRRTLAPRVEGPKQKNRDPLLTAMPSLSAGKMAVVVEANAIRNSPLGEMLIDCMGSSDMGRVQDRLGIDPLTDLDRVAVAGETLMFSGNFASFTAEKVAQEEGSTSRRYGEHATIWERPAGAGGEGGTLAIWRDELIVAGKDRAEVEAAIDRVEGRLEPDGPPAIPDQATSGEVYGSLTAEALAKLIPPEQSAIADRLREVAQHIELHADTTSDVGVVLSVGGDDERDIGDLAQSIGGALALARLTAAGQDQQALADLLDLARVVPRGNDFTVEMALPLAVIEKQLEGCRHRERAPP